MPSWSDVRQFARYHLVKRVHDHPAREQELGVRSLDYDPVAFEQHVRSAAEGAYTVDEVARLHYREAAHPLLRIATKAPENARKRLLVLSGVHGNEHAGILCVPELLQRFADSITNVALVVLTPVNPIGAAELSRFNAQGYDINRDFVRFETEEARVVRDTIATFRPDFVVSLHEGPQDATFAFANAHVRAELAERVLQAVEQEGTPLATHDYFGLKLPRPGLSPTTKASQAIIKLWAWTLSMRASIAYSELQGIPEFTLESSWRNPDRAARLRAHVSLCLAVARELAAQTT